MTNFFFTDSHNIDHSVDLPNPEFNDQVSVKYVKYIKESRGKELIIGKKSGYDNLSKIFNLKYEFKFISEPTKQTLLTFLEISIGKVIEITDYNSNIWSVIVTNPTEITNNSRNNNSFTIEAEVIARGRIIGPWIISQGYLSELPITEGYTG